ncbi:hypothetical protein Drorol1_Dr00013342 [Drosera rotundifolia]
MGNALGNAVNSFGTVIGNTLAAPIKSVFTKSCENICTGAWDLFCFIEHFCIADLVKLLLIFCISYLGLLFLYMLFKLGICKCVLKSMFKMCWAACETCCFMLGRICCFCWHRISNTKRVYRGRRGGLKDIELGYTSAEESLYLASPNSALVRKRKSLSRGRRTNPSITSSRRHLRNTWTPKSHLSRLKSRSVSLRYRGRSGKSSRHLQIRSLNKHRTKKSTFKRRRLR